MKCLKKIFQHNIDLFLPLAAVLMGILIMVLQQPISVQADMAVPMPQSFLGEYSYDGTVWHPLNAPEDVSAANSDLYLRGHFAHTIPENCYLYFFGDHIGGEIFINGELMEQDIILEIQKYGIQVQPSMCSREWKFFYFKDSLPTDALVEIHITNPHKFGNKDAYQYFLETLCCTPNEQEFMAMHLAPAAQPYNMAGIVFAIVGLLLLCSALVSLFLRFPVDITLVQTGLLAAAVGGIFLLDTVDVSFRIESHILTTSGWQICIMYSVYLLGIMARDMLTGKRKTVAAFLVAVSAFSNIAMILISFAGVILMYDTLLFWVMLQWVCCPVLIFCCVAELLAGNQKHRVDLIVFALVYIFVLMDTSGIFSSIYSRGIMTKIGALLLFLLKLVHFVNSIIANFKASSRAQKLEKELEESRIAIMLSQIQPHFIFNVLGTIRGLCREDPEWAWRALGDFSSYLRANMNALTNANFIPFEMELAHIEAYLRLEQMRMGDRLNVVYDIQEKSFFIPPLMLQPLVENAVKHGIFYKEDGGTVIIRSERREGNFVLTVQDDGIGFEAAARESDFQQRQHNGLENVRSRAEKMLGGTLKIVSRSDHGSTVTLEFPIGDQS